ncbi:MAG TPA: hypothetical protein VNL38_03770, partial [Candidatus Nitrosotenuis sp.]|nr:hypothetical protein [Candidatus Nitrosotenuis sp.]
LAHELGHLVAREVPIKFTYILKWALKVTKLGDREDVFDKYHQLLDNFVRHNNRDEHIYGEPKGTLQLRQVAADRFGAHLAALAGYAPEAYADLWDRLNETKGKAGNWFTNFFGLVEPQQERLYAIRQMSAKLKEECRGPSAANPAEFEKWQSEVVAYNGTGLREELSGIVYQKRLQPPLREDVNYFRFSPDGRYLLAQDSTAIHVLSVQGSRWLFSIPAYRALPAQFTPDATSVVFSDRNLQVEMWSVQKQQRTFVQLLAPLKSCLQSLLSPDGRTLACFNIEADLRLLEVTTGKTIYEKKAMITRENMFLMSLLGSVDREFLDLLIISFAEMAFSPDGRYFVLWASDDTAGYDLVKNAPLDLPRSMKGADRKRFSFLAPDRLVVSSSGNKAAVIRFPDGERLEEFEVGGANVSAAAAGNYLVLRPIHQFPAGVLDMKSRKIVLANRRPALDVFNGLVASERKDGEVGFYWLDSDDRLAPTQLPTSTIPYLRAAALSPGMDWLAVSNYRRGGVWNLSTFERVMHVRSFRDAWLGNGPTLYADFPKDGTQEHSIGRHEIGADEGTPIYGLGSQYSLQRGSTVIAIRPANPKAVAKAERARKKELKRIQKEREKQRKKRGEAGGDGKYAFEAEEQVPEMFRLPPTSDAIFDVRDTQSGAVLWSRKFKHETPRSVASPLEDRIVFYWQMPSREVNRIADEDPVLRQRLKAWKDRDADYYVEVVEARTGKKLGGVLVETGVGSFRVRDVLTAGDWVVVGDTLDRLLLFSLSTGDLKAKVFGRYPAICPRSQLLSVEKQRGKLVLYRIPSAGLPEVHQRFSFAEPVAFAQFSRDGQKLFILTTDQTAILLDTTVQQIAN